MRRACLHRRGNASTYLGMTGCGERVVALHHTARARGRDRVHVRFSAPLLFLVGRSLLIVSGGHITPSWLYTSIIHHHCHQHNASVLRQGRSAGVCAGASAASSSCLRPSPSPSSSGSTGDSRGRVEVEEEAGHGRDEESAGHGRDEEEADPDASSCGTQDGSSATASSPPESPEEAEPSRSSNSWLKLVTAFSTSGHALKAAFARARRFFRRRLTFDWSRSSADMSPR